ncbi:hypothetical protein RDWZM_009444, partial [Blomia tropicalis]
VGALLNSREKPIRNDKQLRAIVRIGQSVNFAVERFASVGEAIADDNPEVRNEMYDACKDARAAGSLIEQLCSLTAPSLRVNNIEVDLADESIVSSAFESGFANIGTIPTVHGHHVSHHHDGPSPSLMRSYTDRTAMSRAARALLSSVTRVLLVADSVVIKQIVASKDRVSMSLNRLENVANFTEFVKAFSHFGSEMVELAHLTSDRSSDLKNEKRRAQMAAARRTLERSTIMLLTTAKTCLRHPECISARDNRDTVFAQMRRAMDLIHFVVKEGIVSTARSALPPTGDGSSSIVSGGNVNAAVLVGTGSGVGDDSSPHHFSGPHRPTSSSSSSSSLHLPFDPHNDELLYGVVPSSSDHIRRPHSQSDYFHPTNIPKYQRRGHLHRAQRNVPGGSFVLAVESTLRWLHEQLDTCPTIINFIRRVQELLDLARMGPLAGPVREQIIFALDAAIERTQDFTDSAYTSHEHREKILLMCDRVKADLVALFRSTTSLCLSEDETSPPNEDLEEQIMHISKLLNELRCELQDTALDQAAELFRQHSSLDLPLLLKSSAMDCDHDQVEELTEQFREHADHVQEVCRLLFHVAPNSALQVNAGHTETSVEIHGEQLLTALTTLTLFPDSKIVKENFEVFADGWVSLVGDISQIMREVGEILRENLLRRHSPIPTMQHHSSHYLHHLQRPPPSPPRPPPLPGGRPPPSGGVHPSMGPMGPPHGAVVPMGPPGQPHHHPMMAPASYEPMPGDTAAGPNPMLPPNIMPNDPQQIPHGPHGPYVPNPHLQQHQQQQQIPAQGNGAMQPHGPHQSAPVMKNGRPTNVQINPEVDVVEIQPSNDKWSSPSNDVEDNDIARKAKSMSAMAMAMFQFTRGEGELKTTQDLFTQAEFFADEANKLYKIVRHFTYQIPAGAAKKELLDCIDQVPTYVQQLQFGVKNVTVGKTATFTKVDNVISETKNLMSVITRVVSACMNCAIKYNLDMQGALRTRSRTLSPSYRNDTEMFFEGGAMSKAGVASSDPDI